MSYGKKIRKYGAALSHPAVLFGSKRYIFVLSHMRARSTVLSHVLGSHPEICGHRELHLSYASWPSLLKMRVALYSERGYAASRYLLDKLLYDHLELDPDLFSPGAVSLVVLIRSPAETIKSMERLHAKLFGGHGAPHLKRYYEARLKTLRRRAAELSGNYFFIDSADLIANSEEVLASLTRFLGLQAPLSADYDVFEDTGAAGAGDPSRHIRAGRIQSTGADASTGDAGDSDLNALYEDVRAVLSANAAAVPS